MGGVWMLVYRAYGAVFLLVRGPHRERYVSSMIPSLFIISFVHLIVAFTGFLNYRHISTNHGINAWGERTSEFPSVPIRICQSD